MTEAQGRFQQEVYTFAAFASRSDTRLCTVNAHTQVLRRYRNGQVAHRYPIAHEPVVNNQLQQLAFRYTFTISPPESRLCSVHRLRSGFYPNRSKDLVRVASGCPSIRLPNELRNDFYSPLELRLVLIRSLHETLASTATSWTTILPLEIGTAKRNASIQSVDIFASGRGFGRDSLQDGVKLLDESFG